MPGSQAQFGDMPCLLRIQSMYPQLRPSEKKVADYLLNHSGKVIHLTITQVSFQCGVSDATVVKFAQRLGYNGFHDLKIRLATEFEKNEQTMFEEIQATDNMENIQNKIFDSSIRALQDTRLALNSKQSEAAVKAIAKARVINMFGLGASGLVCLDAEEKFNRIGLVAKTYKEARAQAVAGSLMAPEDVAIAVSYSGETEAVVLALELAKKAGATCIAITNYAGSQLTEFADHVLLISAPIPAFRSVAIGSRIAQLSVMDALFVGVAMERYHETDTALEKSKLAVARERGDR